MPPGQPNLFKEELGRNLNRVFPPSRGGFEVPTVLDGVVRLSHDFPGTLPYLSFSIYDNVGSADLTQIIAGITPPDGFIWLIDEMSVQCTDPVSRVLKLTLRYVHSSGTFVVTLARFDTGTSTLAWPIGRRLIVPPRCELELSVPALGAGTNIRWTAFYFQIPAGQFCPKS